jgi:predicted nucleotidyltransferase
MKTVGLITEYNPFHNGHRYHIEEAKKLTGADHVVVIMSGNYVQRGAPAILDKYSRAEIALKNGADLVLELPVCYATASAEFFALGAIATLDKLNIVDMICFGSESGDINALTEVAKILENEPPELSELISTYVKSGMTFPLARANALLSYLKSTNHDEVSSSHNFPDINEIEKLLFSPNNILGIEYIKAIMRLKSNIIPMTIKRKDSNFHDQDITSAFSSATAIRKSLHEGIHPTQLFNTMPENAFPIMNDLFHKSFPIDEKDFSLLLKYKLLLEKPDTLRDYLDVSGGLEKRIYNLLNEYKDFSQYALCLKTKQFTLTRVTRALLHIILNINDNTFRGIMKEGTVKYARILGFQRSSSHLIKSIKDKGKIIPITKMANAATMLDDVGSTLLDLDVFASSLYNSIVFNKYGYEIKNDYLHDIVIL